MSYYPPQQPVQIYSSSNVQIIGLGQAPPPVTTYADPLLFQDPFAVLNAPPPVALPLQTQQQQPRVGLRPQQQQQQARPSFQPSITSNGTAPTSMYQAADPNSANVSMGPGGQNLLPQQQQSRDHYDFANYDDSILQEEKNLGELKTGWRFYTDMALAAWVLFNSVTTVMIIVQNFKRSISPYDRAAYGEKTFNGIIAALTYSPMVFFLSVILLFNNSYSERVFYKFLAKCAIVDFPASGGFGYMLKSPKSLLFLLVWLAYTLFGVGVMIKFQATVGTIFTFINNLAVGVFLFWYRQQSIESKFISLSDFVQAFPNASNQQGDIDSTSLHRAANFIERLALLESREPSYGDFMRLYIWKSEQYSSFSVVCHHLSVWIIILGMSGAAFAYFFILQSIELKALWTTQVVPCVQVCTAAFSNATGTSGTWATLAQQCTFCTCRCLGAMEQLDPGVFTACTLPNTQCQASICGSLTSDKCALWTP